MSDADYDHLWRDPRYWKSNWRYRCAADRRIVVPKRNGSGWTLNLAHRSTYLLAAAVVLGAIAPTLSLWREGNVEDWPQTLFMSLVMIAVILLCAARIGRD